MAALDGNAGSSDFLQLPDAAVALVFRHLGCSRSRLHLALTCRHLQEVLLPLVKSCTVQARQGSSPVFGRCRGWLARRGQLSGLRACKLKVRGAAGCVHWCSDCRFGRRVACICPHAGCQAATPDCMSPVCLPPSTQGLCLTQSHEDLSTLGRLAPALQDLTLQNVSLGGAAGRHGAAECVTDAAAAGLAQLSLQSVGEQGLEKQPSQRQGQFSCLNRLTVKESLSSWDLAGGALPLSSAHLRLLTSIAPETLQVGECRMIGCVHLSQLSACTQSAQAQCCSAPSFDCCW